MKIKYLAAACAALCSVSAFAATLNPSITPAQTVYIAGASAQKNALLKMVPTTVFDGDVLFVNGPSGSVGWLGTAKSDFGGVTTLVVYNSTNGSAAGLNQLISTTKAEAEAKVLSLPDSAVACQVKSAITDTNNKAAEQVTCTNAAFREADMALSDVYVGEFAPNLLSTGDELVTASSTASTGLEGFGVIVNSVLYNALITKNIADGLLPASCATATAATLVVGTGNGACQPSVRSADYASLVASGGQFNSSAAFGVTAKPITVCRRDDLSGTQAASNIFFLNNVCGLDGYQGAVAVATGADSGTGYTVVDAANVSTGKAEVCVWSGAAAGTTANANYGIGVVSTGEKDAVDTANAKPFYFVKLDGVSPNYKANGAYDITHRANMLNGSYKFATEMAAYAKLSTDLTSGKGLIVNAIADTIALSDSSDLTGIAYLSGTVDPAKTARYSKGGNNCAAWQ